MRDYQHGDNSQVPLGNVSLAQNPAGVLQALQIDNSGNLKTAVTGAGSGGTSSVDKSAFTAGTSAGTPMMGDVNPADTPANGTMAIVALDAARNLKVNVVAGGAGGGAATIADGADVTQGALADAAITTNAAGSLSGKLRGLVALIAQAFNLGTPFRIDPTGSTTQPVNGTVTANQGGAPWTVSQVPATSGGLSTSRTLSVANTTGTNPKGSAGQVYGFIITNTNAAARFVKLYNKATAPTVGTDVPVITLAIPGNATGAGMVAAEFTSGIAFGTGIGLGITTGVADADTGAPAANEVVVNLFYK